MATLEVIDFHNQQMAQERARVMLRIANGTKASSSAQIWNRHFNKSYRGLPDNSTGSRNTPFFITKADAPITFAPSARVSRVMNQEAQQHALPLQPMFLSDLRSADAVHRMKHREEATDALENQIIKKDGRAMAQNVRRKAESLNGGVLKNYRYARKILGQREADVRNQQLVEDGLPREETLVELDPIESRKLELRQLLQILFNNVASGNFAAFGFLEIKNMIRLLISLSPILTESEMIEIVQALDDASGELTELLNDNREASIRDKRADRTIGILYTITNLVNDMRNFLEKMITVVNDALPNKRAAAVQYAKEFSATKKIIGDKTEIQKIRDEIRDALETVIDEPRAPPSAPQPQNVVREFEDEDIVVEDMLPANMQQMAADEEKREVKTYLNKLKNGSDAELEAEWNRLFRSAGRVGRPKQLPPTNRKIYNAIEKFTLLKYGMTKEDLK
jgi:hypothetical protein